MKFLNFNAFVWSFGQFFVAFWIYFNLCCYFSLVTLTFLIEQELCINALHIKLPATGGNKTKTPGPGAQSALRALAHSGMKISRID
ncbi:hypothetical protein ACSBR1_035938 [Camellia fascicularis]